MIKLIIGKPKRVGMSILALEFGKYYKENGKSI